MVRDSRAQFVNPSSDALTVAHALWLFELSENTVEFCGVNSLHLKKRPMQFHEEEILLEGLCAG